MNFVKSLVATAMAAVVSAEKCPADMASLRSATVQNSFSEAAFKGTYYEIAYHDYTQLPKICGCNRSNKSFDLKNKQVDDDFTLNCGNITKGNNQRDAPTWHSALKFNITDKPGYWEGSWAVIPGTLFPDVLLDVGPINSDGQYSWILEFQCVEKLGVTVYDAINFYSSVPEHTYLDVMKAVVEKAGIHHYIYPDHGPQLHIVDQTGCKYNNPNPLVDRHMIMGSEDATQIIN
jgi:hypothetical protein